MFVGANRKSTGAESELGMPTPSPDEDRQHPPAAELPAPTNLLRSSREQQDTSGCL